MIAQMDTKFMLVHISVPIAYDLREQRQRILLCDRQFLFASFALNEHNTLNVSRSRFVCFDQIFVKQYVAIVTDDSRTAAIEQGLVTNQPFYRRLYRVRLMAVRTINAPLKCSCHESSFSLSWRPVL